MTLGMGRRGGGVARPLSMAGDWRAVCAQLACVFALVCPLAGQAQDAETPAAAPPADAPANHPKKVEHKHRHPAPAQRAETPAPPDAPKVAPVAQPAPVPPPAQAAPTGPAAATSPNVFDAQLVKAGATTCAGRISQLAAASMGGVASAGTASNWFAQAPDKRPATLLLGQKYGPGAVPNGATAVIAAPQPEGKCDAFSIQVVPSPLPCAQVRDGMSKNGKQIADLAGVALMQDATSETMLVPTAANTCVLVGVRGVYAK